MGLKRSFIYQAIDSLSENEQNNILKNLEKEINDDWFVSFSRDEYIKKQKHFYEVEIRLEAARKNEHDDHYYTDENLGMLYDIWHSVFEKYANKSLTIDDTIQLIIDITNTNDYYSDPDIYYSLWKTPLVVYNNRLYIEYLGKRPVCLCVDNSDNYVIKAISHGFDKFDDLMPFLASNMDLIREPLYNGGQIKEYINITEDNFDDFYNRMYNFYIKLGGDNLFIFFS